MNMDNLFIGFIFKLYHFRAAWRCFFILSELKYHQVASDKQLTVIQSILKYSIIVIYCMGLNSFGSQ